MPHASAKFWNRMAERYSRSPIADLPAYHHTLERTKSYLKPDDRLLELGCGTGSTALELAGNAGSMLASDISPGMIAIAERKLAERPVGNLRFAVATPENLAAQPDRYDTVLAFNLLHLVDDLSAALASIRELLKHGGLFISKTICLRDPAVPLKVRLMMSVVPLMQLIGLAPAFRKLSIAELERAVKEAGFEIIEAGNFPAAPPRRYLVARKR